MVATHQHSHHSSAAGKHKGQLRLALGLTMLIFAVELLGGYLTNSLTLFADAGHMLTDVLGEAMALLAIWFAERPATPRKTYGYYRVEILAALGNAVLLFGLSAYLIYAAWQRLIEPETVASGWLIAFAGFALAVNLINVALLREAAGASLNMRGAFYEVVSDALGSAAALIAGLVMWLTNWYYADSLFSVAIGLFILPRTWRLLRAVINVLLEATPERLNLAEIESDIRAMPCVRDVHDLHAWTITSGVEALSAHIHVDRKTVGYNSHQTLCDVQQMLHEKHGIEHATLQIEEENLQAQEGKV